MSNFTNHLGNWNPQLLREYRGRLKPRSIIAAIVLSAIAQILLMLSHLQDQPFQELTTQEKWLNLWTSMTWLVAYALFAIGSFYLVSDLTQEEQRGTLNFIRLSPYPAWKILLGKLLGVPVLPYLTIALAIPLHFVATIRAELPLTLFLSYYLLIFAGCIFLYSLAMLYGLAGGVQIGAINRQATASIAFTAIALFAFTPLFLAWNSSVIWQRMQTRFFMEQNPDNSLRWFYIQLADNIGAAHLFTLISLGIGTALIWSTLLRRFRQPRSTLLSKRQSYLILALLEAFFLGFLSEQIGFMRGVPVIFITGFSAILILILTLSICPRRQALLDWSRYQPHGWQSRIWMDKSPIAIATCIQISIAAVLVLPWLLLFNRTILDGLFDVTIAFLAVVNIVFIYSFLIQLIFASKIRNPLIWAIGVLIVGIAVPPAILSFLDWLPQSTDRSASTIWTFFGYPLWNYGDRIHLLFAAFGVVLQWILLAGLLLRFRLMLRRLNTSASQLINSTH